MSIGIIEARSVDHDETEAILLDRVGSDALGVGLEMTCFASLRVPSDAVDELIIPQLENSMLWPSAAMARTLVFPDPVGPMTLFRKLLQHRNDVLGQRSHNDKIIWVCFEAVFVHDKTVDSGRTRAEKVELVRCPLAQR